MQYNWNTLWPLPLFFNQFHLQSAFLYIGFWNLIWIFISHEMCQVVFSSVLFINQRNLWVDSQAGIMGLQDFAEYNISYKMQFWPPGQMWPKMFVKSFRTCFANFWEMRRGRAKTSFVEIFKVSSQLWRGNKGKTRWEMINQTSMESWILTSFFKLWICERLRLLNAHIYVCK